MLNTTRFEVPPNSEIKNSQLNSALWRGRTAALALFFSILAFAAPAAAGADNLWTEKPKPGRRGIRTWR